MEPRHEGIWTWNGMRRKPVLPSRVAKRGDEVERRRSGGRRRARRRASERSVRSVSEIPEGVRSFRQNNAFLVVERRASSEEDKCQKKNGHGFASCFNITECNNPLLGSGSWPGSRASADSRVRPQTSSSTTCRVVAKVHRRSTHIITQNSDECQKASLDLLSCV